MCIMKKKNIIITGSSGFIGNNLVKWLSKKYNVIGIDKQEGTPDGVEFYQKDINYDLPDIENVYAVIHLAATAGVRQSRENFKQYVHDNILGTQSILEKCISDWKPKKLLVASSSSVYSNKSPYAMTKIATEKLVEAYKECGLINCWTCCMRLHTVYGMNQRKGLAIREFIDRMLKDEPISVYGTGEQQRDFTYIDDVCRCIEELLIEGIPLKPFMDIGSQAPVTINYVIWLLSRLMDKEVKIKYEPWNRYDTLRTCANERCVSDITPIEKGLKKQIEWQKEMMK